MDEPHVYIYVYNRNNPAAGIRKIVAATSIKKFQYEKYVQDQEKYKNKLLKLKEGPVGENICYVLYAAGMSNFCYRN